MCFYIKQIKFIIHFFEGISHISSNIFAGDVRYDLFIWLSSHITPEFLSSVLVNVCWFLLTALCIVTPTFHFLPLLLIIIIIIIIVTKLLLIPAQILSLWWQL